MMNILRRIEAFFFAPRSATPWGLMRIVWALSVFVTMLLELPDVTRYYSEAGMLPATLAPIVSRSYLKITLFAYITDPTAVFLAYMMLMLALSCMIVGIWPRLMTMVSILLYFSFHERNPVPLGGGETVLRAVGFLLLISPGLRALSWERAQEQFRHWKKTGSFLAPLTMPAWPKRLLLWQLLIIYLTSLWDKLLGNMWWWGTAVLVPFHHPHFARFSPETMDALTFLAPTIVYSTLIFEGMWALLLIPKSFYKRIPFIRYAHIRRLLLFLGLCFHGGIFVMMNVGSFFFAMMSAYAGMPEGDDILLARRTFNWRWKGRIDVFFDGQCGFCTRSAFWLEMMDWLQRIRLVNFQNPVVRKKFASDIPYENLDRSMHIRFPSGRILTGFDAFRALTWHMPPTWPIAPFLYVPGVAQIGRRVYQWKADNRKKCSHEGCAI